MSTPPNLNINSEVGPANDMTSHEGAHTSSSSMPLRRRRRNIRKSDEPSGETSGDTVVVKKSGVWDAEATPTSATSSAPGDTTESTAFSNQMAADLDHVEEDKYNLDEELTSKRAPRVSRRHRTNQEKSGTTELSDDEDDSQNKIPTTTTRGVDDDITYVPTLQEEAEEQFAKQVAEAPDAVSSQVQSLRELEGQSFSLPVLKQRDEDHVDLSILTNILSAPEQIMEKDVHWTDDMFRELLHESSDQAASSGEIAA